MLLQDGNMKLILNYKSKSQKKVRKKRSFRQWCYDLCATRKRRVIFSVVSAFLIGILCYLMDNTKPFAVLDRADICYFIEKTLPKSSSNNLYDSVFFINTSHDRQLVCLNDTLRHEVGNTDVADRKMLLDFLTMLDTVDYRFLIVDLTFDDKHKTQYDQALYDKLLKMKNVIIADKDNATDDYVIADRRLKRIARRSDYVSYFWNLSFTRYQFLQNKEHSIPLEIVYQMSGKEIHKIPLLPIYYSKAHLCLNSPKIRIHGKFENGKLSIPRDCFGDLGFDFVNYPERNLSADLNGRFVVITDIDNDLHDTYLGKVPGGYIVYEALKFLDNDCHVLKWWHILLTIIVFTLVLLFLFWTHFGSLFVIHNKRSPKLSAFVKWFFTNGILYLFYLVVYLKFSFVFNIIIPVTYVTVVAFIINKSKQYEKNISNVNSAVVA